MESKTPETSTPTTNWTASKVIQAVLVVLSVLGAFLLIYYFRNVVILIFIGIAVGISMKPAVNWLNQRKISIGLGVILIYLLLLLVLVGVILLVIPPAIQQSSALIPTLEGYYKGFQATLVNSPNFLLHQIGGNLPSLNSLTSNFGKPAPGAGSPDLVTLTLTIARFILASLFTISVVLLIGFYWTLEGERLLYSFSLLFPIEKRDNIRATIEEIENRVGGFVRGQGLLSVAIGVAALLAYSVIGLPSVLSLAFFAAICELIPVFGPILGAIPAVFITLSFDPSKVIWVILVTTAIQLLENHVLAPRVMERTVGVNPMVTILSIIGFGSLFGLSGLLLAIPLAAVVQVLIDRVVLNPQETPAELLIGRNRISKLTYDAQEFVQDIHKRIRDKEVGIIDADSDEIEDAIEVLATDLDTLLVDMSETNGSE